MTLSRSSTTSLASVGPITRTFGFLLFLLQAVGGDILAACPEIHASTGAACHSGGPARSAVLEAMDVPETVAFGAIRFSLGRETTSEEIDAAVALLLRATNR